MTLLWRTIPAGVSLSAALFSLIAVQGIRHRLAHLPAPRRPHEPWSEIAARLAAQERAWWIASAVLGLLGLLAAALVLVRERDRSASEPTFGAARLAVARWFIGTLLASCAAWAWVETTTRAQGSWAAWLGAGALALVAAIASLGLRSVAVDGATRRVIVRWGEPLALRRRVHALDGAELVHLDSVAGARVGGRRWRVSIAGERMHVQLARNLGLAEARELARRVGEALSLEVGPIDGD